MSNELLILSTTAVGIGFFHTILGPDHYLPFIVLAKARKWSIPKTAFITFLCGLGHILSSVVLGLIGVALGVAVFKLESIESFRGDLAGWLLLIFGFTYFIWGLRRAIYSKEHKHKHIHPGQPEHTHIHSHLNEHFHYHKKEDYKNLTPWVLFIVFVFGPCEPLIPLLMYPAAKMGMGSVGVIAAVFGAVTISTMLGVVLLFSLGLTKWRIRSLEKYSHALAGFAILFCGIAIKFLGL